MTDSPRERDEQSGKVRMALEAFPGDNTAEEWMAWCPFAIKEIERLRLRVIELETAATPSPREPMIEGERCEDCDRAYGEFGAVWRATDELWAIVGWGERGLLCPDCFTKRVVAKGVTPYFVAVDRHAYTVLMDPSEAALNFLANLPGPRRPTGLKVASAE